MAASRALASVCDVVLDTDDISELFQVGRPLSSGAQLGWNECTERETGKPLALREYKAADLRSESKRAEFRAAICAMRLLVDTPTDMDELRSVSLTRLHSVVGTPGSVYVICDRVPTGSTCTDLLAQIQQRGRLKEADARSVFARLVLATKRAHDCGVVLRDIKPERVQVRVPSNGGSDWQVQLAPPLHCAALGPGGEPSLCGLVGTPEYAAPEVVIWYWHESLPEPPPPYGEPVDAWALGVTLHVMLSGGYPFDAELPEEQLLRAINAADVGFSEPGWRNISDDALELLRSLLTRDPEERAALEEVMQHPFCEPVVQEVLQLEGERSVRDEDYDAALKALDSDGDGDDDS